VGHYPKPAVHLKWEISHHDEPSAALLHVRKQWYESTEICKVPRARLPIEFGCPIYKIVLKLQNYLFSLIFEASTVKFNQVKGNI